MQIGQIMHTTLVPWRVDRSMAGVMLAPVLFAMLTLLCAVILIAIYLLMQVPHHSIPPSSKLFRLHCVDEHHVLTLHSTSGVGTALCLLVSILITVRIPQPLPVCPNSAVLSGCRLGTVGDLRTAACAWMTAWMTATPHT